MNTNKILIVGLAAAIATAIASVMIANRKVAPPVESSRVVQPTPAPAPKPIISEPAPPANIPAVETKPQIQPAPANVQPAPKPRIVAPRTAPPANANDPQDPTAREALSFVGADPDANEYWLGAINNPNLPANERQNLIEDLNEDGLSDPQNPGPEDLPLILNRIQLIEELAPNAMDQVNADAFAEAYKDLVNMVNGLPVP